MRDNFCATFLAHSGESRGFMEMLFNIFYTIHCNVPFAFVIVGILSAVGIFALIYFRAHSLAIKIAKIPFALILTALFIISLIATFKDFSVSVVMRDSALGRAFFALAMKDITFYVRILIAICVASVVLFFATRFILGRQVNISGDFWEHQSLAKSKVAWLNTLFFAMLTLICLCAFSLFQIIFISFGVDFSDGIGVENDIAMTNELLKMSGLNMQIVPNSASIADFDYNGFIANRIASLKVALGISAVFVLVLWLSYFFKSIAMRNNGIEKLADSLNADEIFGDTKRNRASLISRNIQNGGDINFDDDSESLVRVLDANGVDRTDLMDKQNDSEKRVFNAIEEMAIASNMPMPRVFIMRGENGINAMCSGERFGYADEKIAIFVTQGAVDNFTREELQGVIAHEFSHAFHGDVALNLKIFSLIFALTWTMMLGEFFLRSCMRQSRSRSSGKNKGGGVIVIALIALVFYVLGFLGTIFAKIIQSAISRQKEFLADASSVQYTRNVNGIKSALKRIKDLQDNGINAANRSPNSANLHGQNVGVVNNISAKPCAHMFFLNSVSGFFSKIFATHPSLEMRIKALDKIG